MEIANGSNTPILLYPGRRIGQLVLIEIAKDKATEIAVSPHEALNRTYFGPVLPEPPEFNDPALDLKAIGVRYVRVIPPSSFKDTTGMTST